MKKVKNNITELVFILDRSGSMGGLESDTIGGFNEKNGAIEPTARSFRATSTEERATL